MREYESAISAVVRADAEAARSEIRAAGIACPSCGVNLADLPEGHVLAVTDGPEGPYTAECSRGETVQLNGTSPMTDADFALWQAVASISMLDDFRRREAESLDSIIGNGPAQFTGLLEILNGEDG